MTQDIAIENTAKSLWLEVIKSLAFDYFIRIILFDVPLRRVLILVVKDQESSSNSINSYGMLHSDDLFESVIDR